MTLKHFYLSILNSSEKKNKKDLEQELEVNLHVLFNLFITILNSFPGLKFVYESSTELLKKKFSQIQITLIRQLAEEIISKIRRENNTETDIVSLFQLSIVKSDFPTFLYNQIHDWPRITSYLNQTNLPKEHLCLSPSESLNWWISFQKTSLLYFFPECSLTKLDHWCEICKLKAILQLAEKYTSKTFAKIQELLFFPILFLQRILCGRKFTVETRTKENNDSPTIRHLKYMPTLSFPSFQYYLVPKSKSKNKGKTGYAKESFLVEFQINNLHEIGFRLWSLREKEWQIFSYCSIGSDLLVLFHFFYTYHSSLKNYFPPLCANICLSYLLYINYERVSSPPQSRRSFSFYKFLKDVKQRLFILHRV